MGENATVEAPEQLGYTALPFVDSNPVSSPVVHEFGYFFESTEQFWMALAREKGLRLPRPTTPCTPDRMIKWIHKLGLSYQWFRDWTGFERLSQWIAANPTWKLRQFVGLVLEGAHDCG